MIKLIMRFKKFYYLMLSDCKNIEGKAKAKIKQPTLFVGKGRITLGEKVKLGYFPSAFFYNGHCYIEARQPNSHIIIGDNTVINNNVSIIANEGNILIGKKCLIGTNVEIFNTDFHHICPEKRHSKTTPISKDVIIKDNVWIGNSVKILKGVTIGKNSVIGAASVVTKDVPDNVVAAGCPIKIIKNI